MTLHHKIDQKCCFSTQILPVSMLHIADLNALYYSSDMYLQSSKVIMRLLHKIDQKCCFSTQILPVSMLYSRRYIWNGRDQCP